jgi:hypothetical protein
VNMFYLWDNSNDSLKRTRGLLKTGVEAKIILAFLWFLCNTLCYTKKGRALYREAAARDVEKARDFLGFHGQNEKNDRRSGMAGKDHALTNLPPPRFDRQTSDFLSSQQDSGE